MARKHKTRTLKHQEGFKRLQTELPRTRGAKVPRVTTVVPKRERSFDRRLQSLRTKRLRAVNQQILDLWDQIQAWRQRENTAIARGLRAPEEQRIWFDGKVREHRSLCRYRDGLEKEIANIGQHIVRCETQVGIPEVELPDDIKRHNLQRKEQIEQSQKEYWRAKQRGSLESKNRQRK